MPLGRSSQFQSNFAGWLVYFMMHRFKFTEKGAKDATCTHSTQHTHTLCVYNRKAMYNVIQHKTHSSMYTQMLCWWYWERTKWYRCYFIEIENYEKHIHISLENIVSSIFCSSPFCEPNIEFHTTHTHIRTYISAVSNMNQVTNQHLTCVLWKLVDKQWIHFDWTWNEIRATNVLCALNLIYCFNNILPGCIHSLCTFPNQLILDSRWL